MSGAQSTCVQRTFGLSVAGKVPEPRTVSSSIPKVQKQPKARRHTSRGSMAELVTVPKETLSAVFSAGTASECPEASSCFRSPAVVVPLELAEPVEGLDHRVTTASVLMKAAVGCPRAFIAAERSDAVPEDIVAIAEAVKLIVGVSVLCALSSLFRPARRASESALVHVRLPAVACSPSSLAPSCRPTSGRTTGRRSTRDGSRLF